MEAKTMRKATLCFLLLLFSALAFGQEPQWTVVQRVVLFDQSRAIPTTAIFTPTEPGLYRFTLYLSATGGRNGSGSFIETISGTDISGARLASSYQVECGRFFAYWMPIAPITVSLEPNEPLVYKVDQLPPPGSTPCKYN